jgi:hypothetical protein
MVGDVGSISGGFVETYGPLESCLLASAVDGPEKRCFPRSVHQIAAVPRVDLLRRARCSKAGAPRSPSLAIFGRTRHKTGCAHRVMSWLDMSNSPHTIPVSPSLLHCRVKPGLAVNRD